MGDFDETIRILQDLVNICRDGQNGYQDAAEHVTHSNLRQLFDQQSLERAGFAVELQEELIARGQIPSATVGADDHPGWIDEAAVLGGDNEFILKQVEAGEDAARNAYEKALEAENLPEHLAAVVRRQLATIEAAHDHVRRLRGSKAA